MEGVGIRDEGRGSGNGQTKEFAGRRKEDGEAMGGVESVGGDGVGQGAGGNGPSIQASCGRTWGVRIEVDVNPIS